MITISLNGEAIKQNGLTIGEVLVLIATQNKVDLEESKQKLILNGMLTAERNDLFQAIGWKATSKGADTLNNVIIDSDKSITTTADKLESLAAELKKVFPAGKKEGTNLYWADGISLIIRRLKIFFKKYGTTYTDEQILQAAKEYVASFNGDYRFMKLLKYFIFKEKMGANREIEPESELMTYIENAGQEDLNSGWLTEIR